MADQNEERKLDELLDSALAVYSVEEPRAGLEGRVLAAIREDAERPRAAWWSLAWLAGAAAVAGAAALILGLLFFRPAKKPMKVEAKTPVPEMHAPVPQTSYPSGVGSNSKVVAQRKRPVHHETQPAELAQRDRPPVFPTPTGLSEQEKLLLSYLAQTPTEELIAQARIPDPAEEEEFWKDQQPAVVRPQR
jgi:hypothetical protein